MYNLDNFIIFVTLFAAEENSGLLHSGKIFIDAKPSFSHLMSRAALLRIIKFQLWMFPNQIHLSFKVWLKKRFVVSSPMPLAQKHFAYYYFYGAVHGIRPSNVKLCLCSSMKSFLSDSCKRFTIIYFISFFPDWFNIVYLVVCWGRGADAYEPFNCNFISYSFLLELGKHDEQSRHSPVQVKIASNFIVCISECRI